VKLTVEQAAAIMGVTAQHLRIGLQQQRYPFGAAVRMSRRWSYYINSARFEKYMRGEELAPANLEREGVGL
jgi:hypothetical protein